MGIIVLSILSIAYGLLSLFTSKTIDSMLKIVYKNKKWSIENGLPFGQGKKGGELRGVIFITLGVFFLVGGLLK